MRFEYSIKKYLKREYKEGYLKEYSSMQHIDIDGIRN